MENESGAIIIFTLLVVFILLLIVLKLTEFFVGFNRETGYIISEMRRAGDYNEYRYWRRELRCHYLRLIPFVNGRNVMRLYHRLYHRPKRAENQRRSDGLSHLLAPTVIGACICAVCLCGASWAWFTASTSTGTAKIQAAAYTVSVTAKEGESEVTPKAAENGATAFELEAGKEYKIEITPNGNATAGYCKVNFGKEYYTEQLTSGSLSFTVYADNKGTLTVTPEWGTCAIEGARLGNGEGNLKAIGTKPAGNTVSDTAAPEANEATVDAPSAESDSASEAAGQ